MSGPGSPAVAALGADVAARAKRGVVLIVSRGFLLRLIGLLCIVVLTRFLSPREFGLLAVGTTAVGFSNLLNDGGVGAALLRREGVPTTAELRGVVGIQFGITFSVWLVAVVIACVTQSTVAAVTAIMLGALPLASLKTPASILLEREMTYGPLIVADFSEAFVYSAIAITSVALGGGVWGVAAAAVLKLLVGIAILWSKVPGAIALPSARLGAIRPMLRFGVQFQAVSVIAVFRDQGINLLVAALGGLSALGLWSIANRVLQVVGVVLESLWRVAFPAMARMLETKSDPGRAVGRTVTLVALGLGVVLVPVVMFGPRGIPLVFGPEWSDAADVLPWACLGIAIAAPISTACAGYLYARGDARTVLVANISHTIVACGVIALLLRPVGLAAIGLATLASGIVDFCVLGRATRRTIDTPLIAPTAGLVLMAGISCAVGLSAGSAISNAPASVVASVTVGLASYLALIVAAHRWLLPPHLRVDLRALARQIGVATHRRVPTRKSSAHPDPA